MKRWLILGAVVALVACNSREMRENDRDPSVCISQCGLDRVTCQTTCSKIESCLIGCNSTYDTCVRVCGGEKKSGDESRNERK